jgi:hypothetical protein
MYIFLNDKSIRKNEISIKNIQKPIGNFWILHIEQKMPAIYVYIEQKAFPESLPQSGKVSFKFQKEFERRMRCPS